jgi:protein-arginine kinase activator protein McsA
MNEVLKQAYQLLLTEPHAPTVCDQLEVIFRQAIAELESQEQNFCPRCGKRTNDIHTCTPPQRTEQEPVKLPCCGYTDASAVKWNPFNRVVQCHNCGQTYTQPQRTWVGLTDEEKGFCAAPTYVETVARIEAKLKEKNT